MKPKILKAGAYEGGQSDWLKGPATCKDEDDFRELILPPLSSFWGMWKGKSLV
jgi:hypothetical protein